MEKVTIYREGSIEGDKDAIASLKMCPEIIKLIEGVKELVESPFISSSQTLSHLNKVIKFEGQEYQIEVI